MKAVIFAGGMGTRISEETLLRPKPMIEIGGRPIIWHIMKIYALHGISDFVVCLGYKGYVLKEYFANYFMYMSDITIDLGGNSMEVHNRKAEPWKITLVDTGDRTETAGRLRRVAPYLDAEDFCVTYGDGVSDVDLAAVIAQHRAQRVQVTLTAVQPPGRYGALDLSGITVKRFQEKPVGEGGWVNGGFFVCSPAVFDYIDRDADGMAFERRPLERLAADGCLAAYYHRGFWQAMDTLRDREYLEDLWTRNVAPWKKW